MPVSTRSHGIDQPSPLKNPHHGLKEKMKALTLFYEQQKQSSRVLKNPTISHKDNDNNTMLNSTITRNLVVPHTISDDLHRDKENVIVIGNGIDQNRIVGFPCPRKASNNGVTTVVRKLSMGGKDLQLEQKVENFEEIKVISENSSVGSRILVFVRLRPMAKKEKEAGSRCCVRIVNSKDVYLTEFASENDYLRLKRVRGRHFCFDASFTDSTTQQEVYSTTTAELVEGVLQGKNGSVFCYGATGAGKTYTMLGTVENPGVMVLAIKDLFAKIRQRSCDGNHVVHLSYLEVYNETVRDLLSPGRPLVLREDKQGIVAAGLTQYRAYSTDEVMALLQRGNQNRTTEPTRANETSSRSHAILQVVAEYRARDASQNIVSRIGKLSLIDLAGSERALATDQRTLRSIEGANINRSLLALSSCINALVEGKKHIPFRNSKLTQLLKDSLGGACNTVMIANISPSNLSFGETQNTLHWADRAKEIRTKACEANEELLPVPTNDADQAKLLLEVQKENRDLRMQLARQQQKLLTVQAQSLAVNSTATPSSTTSMLTPPTTKPSEKRRTRSSFLTGNCFTTPDSKRRPAAVGETVRVLQQTVKVLEEEMKRMKEDHALQIKQKDSFINDLTRKLAKSSTVGVEGVKRIVTRSSLRPKASTGACELKSPKQRFESPAPAAKKRTFWDITTANSPSMTTISGRKTRSHIAKPTPAPSMLLQPGFAREKTEPFR